MQIVHPTNWNGEKLPTLVLVPGGFNSGSEFTHPKIAGGPSTAAEIANAGFNVVVFDPDGRGKSSGAENANGFIHQDGLAAVIRFAATLPEVDASQIGVVTFSYGITIGSGALARYPDLPVRFLIDWEGPANRNDTTVGCRGDDRAQKHAPCTDDQYWAEREALTFIAQIRVPYQRIQSEQDHVQPDVGHAVEMIDAAVRGGVPYVRLNDLAPNQTFDPSAPPPMLPEALDRQREASVVKYARELFETS
jgi:pimeloyl-ACP methyl ester carboxylesterase